MKTESPSTDNQIQVASKQFACKLAHHGSGDNGGNWTIVLTSDVNKMIKRLDLRPVEHESHAYILKLLQESKFSEALRQIILARLVFLAEKDDAPDEMINCGQITAVKEK